MRNVKLAALLLGLCVAVTGCAGQNQGAGSAGAVETSAAETAAESAAETEAPEEKTESEKPEAVESESEKDEEKADQQTEESSSAEENTAEKESEEAAEAETDTEKQAESYEIYEQMDGIIFGFLSGVGAWETMLEVEPDGSFSGEFYDANMGETGEGYPNGTLYVCEFTGKFSKPEKVDETSYSATVEKLEYATEKDGSSEFIEDKTLYIMTSPYGLGLGDEILIYTPGKLVSELSEGFMSWMMWQIPEDAVELDEIAIYNKSGEYVFYPDQYAMGTMSSDPAEDSGESKAYQDLKNAYYRQTMPDYYKTPYVPATWEAPPKPYQSVTMENLQGRWVNRYKDGGYDVVEVLSVNGDLGRIETWIDGEKRGVWNGEGTISIEDRSDRNVCPAFRINEADGQNLCTIYIRWVNSNAFYDGGFLKEWKREGNADPDQYLYDTVTLDNLQGVWYTESQNPDGLYQVVLTVDGDQATLFETIDGRISSTWNGGGTAGIVLQDFTAGIAYPELLIKMEHGPSMGGTAGIYISNVEEGYFYDCGLHRWYTRVPVDFLAEDESASLREITMLDNGGAEITGTYHYLVTPKEEIKKDESALNWTVEVTNDEGMNETIQVELDSYTNYKPFANDIVWEEDVNFDGIQDIVVPRGWLGAQSVSYYECYLSDGKKLTKCKGFDEIPNPFPVASDKLVCGTIRDGAAAYYSLSYRIDGDQAVLVEETRFEYDEEAQDYICKE